MAVSFGVTTSAGSYGLAQNVELTDTVELAVARDAEGDGNTQQAHGRKRTISFEYVLDGTPPAVGSTITVSTVAYVVTSVKTIESNEDFKRVQVEAEHNTTAVP